MDFSEIEKKLKPIFKKDKSILFVYLFGSAITKKWFNSKSDIDLAVYLDEKKVKDTFEKRLKLMTETERILKRETEVIILNDMDSIFFKFAIIKEGKLIFERNHRKRVDFELEAMRDYFEFEPFIKQYDEAFIKRNS